MLGELRLDVLHRLISAGHFLLFGVAYAVKQPLYRTGALALVGVYSLIAWLAALRRYRPVPIRPPPSSPAPPRAMSSSWGVASCTPAARRGALLSEWKRDPTSLRERFDADRDGEVKPRGIGQGPRGRTARGRSPPPGVQPAGGTPSLACPGRRPALPPVEPRSAGAGPRLPVLGLAARHRADRGRLGIIAPRRRAGALKHGPHGRRAARFEPAPTALCASRMILLS
jgi:hypothetical protein